MIDTLLSVIAPHHCCGCGKVGTLLCDNCKYNIIDEHKSVCLVCKRPTGERGICTNCRVPYQRAWHVGERTEALQRLIGVYKFSYARSAYRPLADVLLQAVAELPASTIVVPVPTVRGHVRERGYDHMALIADRFAKKRGLPMVQLLVHQSHTTQRHASATARNSQAKHAFAVRGVIDPTATYLLIDDVITTGATLRYTAKALKDAGATTVWVAVIAYQTLD